MKPSSFVNLDINASYGLLPEVAEQLARSSSWLNPSSIHRGGQLARALVEEAREAVAALIGAGSGTRVVFCSGATEANNTVVTALHWLGGGPWEAVISAVEHPSVRAPALRLQAAGGVQVREVAPDAGGAFSAARFTAALMPAARLAAVMLANNETGQVLPVAEIASSIKRAQPRCIVHCDAVQALGKMPVDFAALGVDSLSLSAHKIGGLSGVGALVITEELELQPLLCGGPQEQRLRAGTENVLGIYSSGWRRVWRRWRTAPERCVPGANCRARAAGRAAGERAVRGGAAPAQHAQSVFARRARRRSGRGPDPTAS